MRAPSEFSITRGWLPSMIATQLLVVPRSIPMTLAMFSIPSHSGDLAETRPVAASGPRFVSGDDMASAPHVPAYIGGGLRPCKHRNSRFSLNFAQGPARHGTAGARAVPRDLPAACRIPRSFVSDSRAHASMLRLI